MLESGLAGANTQGLDEPGLPPSLTGDVAADIATLSRHVEKAEKVLARLPSNPQRSQQQRALADAAHDGCRALRGEFLKLHTRWLYDELTSRRTLRLRIDELATRASDVVPGLVPNPAQIAAERERPQAEKEGREIDQGLLFCSLLRCPEIGTHIIESMLQPGIRAQRLIREFEVNGLMKLDTLQIQRVGQAAHITVQNDKTLNAEDDTLIADMETAVDLALLDDKVRVCVLRGGEMKHPKYAGRRVFSAGINRKHLRDGHISFVSFILQRELGYIHKILRGAWVDESKGLRTKRLEKPWIAVVDSFAIGGGAQLLLVFDHVIAEHGAYFALPAAREGIVPGVANLRLSRSTHPRLGRQVILGGRQVRCDEPDGSLLFDRVVAPSDIDNAVHEAISLLSSPAAVTNRRMLNLAEEPIDQFRCYMAEFALEQVTRLYARDVMNNVSH